MRPQPGSNPTVRIRVQLCEMPSGLPQRVLQVIDGLQRAVEKEGATAHLVNAKEVHHSLQPHFAGLEEAPRQVSVQVLDTSTDGGRALHLGKAPLERAQVYLQDVPLSGSHGPLVLPPELSER